MKHEKKIWPEFFEEVLKGSKTFELRLADWECREGDELILREWDPVAEGYTGRSISKKVGYVLKAKDLSFFDSDELERFGYQVISLKG